ncbi:MAG: hypothetical protein IR153_06495 [Flavobacterium sp.]|nr:hypothetical protein [Flavobacterium sp.]
MRYFSLFLLGLSSLFITSCSDVEPIDPNVVINEPGPNPGNPGNPVPAGIFKVDIDGVPFTTSNTMVYISGGSIILNAYGPQGNSFAFLLDGTTTGSYAANDNIVAYTPAGSEAGYWGNHPTDPTANTGSVIITSINTTAKTISGTFSYTGYWSDDSVPAAPQMTFTNGTFTNLPYVSQNPTNDTFFAKVNGTEFVDTDILGMTIAVNNIEYISVGAEDAATRAITVSVRSNLNTGIYPITGNTSTDPVQLTFALDESSSAVTASAGTITITEKTADRIKGTFTATVTINATAYQITEGAFDVGY